MEKSDSNKFGASRKGFDPKKKLSRSFKPSSSESKEEKQEDNIEELEKEETKTDSEEVQEPSTTSTKEDKVIESDQVKLDFEEDKPDIKEKRSAKVAFKPFLKDKDEPAIEKEEPKSSSETPKKSFKPFLKGELRPKLEKKEAKIKGKKGLEPIKRNFDDGPVRLNKFIANSGLCSRREADELIKSGVIKVNGEVVTEMGVKINREDKVQHNDEYLRGEQQVYLLLNKSKDYITALKDAQGRKTIADLIKGACKERIFPVGVLDRNATGLLLMTNDSELASKLTHPLNKIKQVYQVVTDKEVSEEDLQSMVDGIELSDGLARFDVAAHGSDHKTIGIELHTGKSRIVKQMFDALGHRIVKLDRIIYAELSKKQVPRGEWRMLNDKEVSFLKMMKTDH